MKSKVSSNKKRCMRIIALPWRALTKARDCYVNSMTNYTAVNPRTLPKSYSTASTISSRSINNSEDFRELVRAASARSNMGDTTTTFDLNLNVQQQIKQQMPSRKVVRSCSVGMARIDEDKPCVLGEDQDDVMMKKDDLKYPRSKSYAITKKNNVVF